MGGRLVNIRYKVGGLNFDAAIDCNWQLHCYGVDPEEKKRRVPIELYCFDNTDWDIRMIYQEFDNDQSDNPAHILHTACDFENIIEETKKWILEMKGTIEEDKGTEVLFT